ncbi:hypothetical protein ACFP3Q_05925 [Nocardioides sp. GCM10027113]|uniref:hypothetical protein n=1 Tax=unclassified Nocardioides TaxID=2615069 RepID=UPI00360A2FC2
MTATPTATALHSLTVALDAPPLPLSAVPEAPTGATASWRWQVRRLLGELRDALGSEGDAATDGWLAARSVTLLRERDLLLGRLGRLGPVVLQSPDVAGICRELRRLTTDIGHYCQRLHDLAYDEVELELGGSE